MIQTSLERIETPTHSNLEQLTKANGEAASETEKAAKSGQMVLSMKGSGAITGHMELGSLCMLTMMSMKENGQMIRLTVEVSIDIKMEQLMMGSGKMIFSMGKALRSGLMGLSTKEST